MEYIHAPVVLSTIPTNITNFAVHKFSAIQRNPFTVEYLILVQLF